MEIAVFIVFAGLLGGLLTVWSFARAKEIRARWAEENGFEIESARFCWFWRGPFWWRSTDSQMVFRIEGRDREGRRRAGWLRCGGWFSGLFGSQATVAWDDE